jgi:hypothetical protein
MRHQSPLLFVGTDLHETLIPFVVCRHRPTRDTNPLYLFVGTDLHETSIPSTVCRYQPTWRHQSPLLFVGTDLFCFPYHSLLFFFRQICNVLATSAFTRFALCLLLLLSLFLHQIFLLLLLLLPQIFLYKFFLLEHQIYLLEH